MILPAIPVRPRIMEKIPRVISNATSACILACPSGNVRQYAISSGIAGVIHPGTTGSPNNVCQQ